MRTSEQTDKLMPALIGARAGIRPAGKSGENKFDRYDYATELDWHAAVMPALLNEKCCLCMSVDEVENLPDRTTKNGGIEHCVQVFGSARVTHESGQWLEVNGVGQGQDRADKAAYKATTGLKKYLYALLFALPTTDDPERDETVGRDLDDRRPVDAKVATRANGKTNGAPPHLRRGDDEGSVQHIPSAVDHYKAFRGRMKRIFDGYEVENAGRLDIVKEACRQVKVDYESLSGANHDVFAEIERRVSAHLAGIVKA